jgi:hypothetical protein
MKKQDFLNKVKEEGKIELVEPCRAFRRDLQIIFKKSR